MTTLYALDLKPCQNGRWQRLLPGLPRDRQEQILTLRRDNDRARSAGAGWLLQYALEQAGIPAGEQRLVRTPLGKPVLEGHAHLHVSLSHSGDWAVCAVSHLPVGVDVESPRCTMEIGRRFFRPDEMAGLDQLPEAERRDRLNRLWTAKEAFVKAMGGGLTIPLNSFSVTLSCDKAVLVQTCSPLPYVLHEYRLGSYRVCLCAADERPEILFPSIP